MKLTLLGDPRVGKTSIFKEYMGEGFPHTYLPTMGVDFAVKRIQREDGILYEIQVWDIAGQSGFDILLPRYLQQSDGALFVFDLTRKDTFINLERWIKDFIKANPVDYKDSILVIVGNKMDLDNHVVDHKTVQEFMTEITRQTLLSHRQLIYIQTSALTGNNIDQAFLNFVKITQIDG